MGDESLDVDEVGIGLDGAENMGQDGERGEVGLGFGGLQDRTIRKLVSTEGNHNGGTRFMGGQMMGSWSRQRSTETWLCCQCQVTFLQTRPRYIPSSISSAILWNIKESLCPAEQLLSRSQELFRRCALPTGGRCPGPVCASSRSHSSTSPQGTGIVSKEPSGSTAVRVFLKLDLSKNDHFSGPHGPFRQKTISCLHF